MVIMVVMVIMVAMVIMTMIIILVQVAIVMVITVVKVVVLDMSAGFGIWDIAWHLALRAGSGYHNG